MKSLRVRGQKAASVTAANAAQIQIVRRFSAFDSIERGSLSRVCTERKPRMEGLKSSPKTILENHELYEIHEKGLWSLKFGASLMLGAWMLELFARFAIRPALRDA